METAIRRDQELLLNSLTNGKLPRNVRWADVLDLIAQIGSVEPRGNDEFAFQVETQKAFFKRPHGHDMDLAEVSRLRHFLKQSGLACAIETKPIPGRIVVVIDHRGAHIYKDVEGSRPVDEVTAIPYDPFGFHRHLVHRKEAHYRDDHIPEESSFYEEIAHDLAHAEEIVLIGHGTGKSSAVNFLEEFLKKHHVSTAQKIVGIEIADLSALTEPEIEQLAKKHLAL